MTPELFKFPTEAELEYMKDFSERVKCVTISTFDWSDYTEIGSYPDNLKPKFKKNNYDSVSGKVIDEMKKYLKS